MGNVVITEDLSQGILSGVEIQSGKLVLSRRQVLTFDGTDDYVGCGAHSTLNLTNNWTLEARIYLSTIKASTNFVMVKYDGAGGNHNIYGLELDSLGRPQGRVGKTGSGNLTLPTTTPVPLNQWTHLALSYDSSLTSDNLKIFMDGAQLASGTHTAGAGTTPNALNIARDGTANTGFFQGKIEDVRIWNVTRTQTQIDTNKYAELVGNESGLVRLFKFNEGTGNVLTDSTANAQNGSIVGATWSQELTGKRISPIYTVSL